MNSDDPRNNYAFRFCEYFFIKSKKNFDSILVISLLERFKKENPNSTYLEQILHISEKFDLYLIQDNVDFSRLTSKTNIGEYVFFLAPDFAPVIILSESFGFFKIKNIITNKTKLIRKNVLEKSIQNSNSKIQILYQDSKYLYQEDIPHLGHRTILDTLLTIINYESRDIWIMTVYSIAIGFLSLVIPIGIQSLVNILNFGTVFQPIIILTILVILALGFAGVLSIMQFYLAELIQQRVFVRISLTVSKRLALSKRKYFSKTHGPELANYFLDISTIQKGLTLILTDGLAIFLQTAIGLLVLVIYHPIFILFDIFLFAMIYVCFKFLGTGGISTSINESKAKYKTESWMEEVSINSNSFRSKNSEIYSGLRVEESTKEYLKYRTKHYKILIKQMIGFISIQAIGSGILLSLGGWLVIKGEITLGQLVAAEIIVAKILDKFPKFDKYLESYYDLCASIDKMNHLLDIEVETKTKETIDILKKPFSVSLKSVNYSDHKKQILKDINLEVKPGEFVGIYGSTNSGKTSFFELLYGLNQPQSGAVYINEDRINEVDIFELRNHISYLNDLEVFSGTIQDAVRVGHFELKPSDIRIALEKAELAEKIQNLEEGLDSKILRNHYPLNRQEQLKLMFARIFAANSGLLLIDDMLRYFDELTRKRFLKKLADEKKNSTIIMSTHDKDDLVFCDITYELINGELKKLKLK